MAPKKKDLSYFQAVTREMVEHDSSLREQQKKYEAASQLRHTLPEPLDQLEWVIPYKSAVPFVALKGGTQALSGLRIRPSIHPITTRKVKGSDATADQIANYWETVLEWELGRAMRRGPAGIPPVTRPRWFMAITRFEWYRHRPFTVVGQTTCWKQLRMSTSCRHRRS